VFGEATQNLHHLWPEADFVITPREQVRGRLDPPVTEAESGDTVDGAWPFSKLTGLSLARGLRAWGGVFEEREAWDTANKDGLDDE
jgi:hypothetical protein